jgi:hypothetical protein
LSYGLVSSETISKALPILNTSYIQTNDVNLNAAYRVGFELGHSILRLFWRPKRFIRDQVTLFYDKHFKGDFVIGIQLRFGYLNGSDVDVFIKCAQQIEIRAGGEKSFKWFVSADDETGLLALKKRFPDKVLHAEGEIIHTFFFASGYLKAVMDSELLALTDEMIITGGSTFGFVAAMKKLKYPWTVNGSVNAQRYERFSFGKPSPTPANYDTV